MAEKQEKVAAESWSETAVAELRKYLSPLAVLDADTLRLFVKVHSLRVKAAQTNTAEFEALNERMEHLIGSALDRAQHLVRNDEENVRFLTETIASFGKFELTVFHVDTGGRLMARDTVEMLFLVKYALTQWRSCYPSQESEDIKKLNEAHDRLFEILRHLPLILATGVCDKVNTILHLVKQRAQEHSGWYHRQQMPFIHDDLLKAEQAYNEFFGGSDSDIKFREIEHDVAVRQLISDVQKEAMRHVQLRMDLQQKIEDFKRFRNEYAPRSASQQLEGIASSVVIVDENLEELQGDTYGIVEYMVQRSDLYFKEKREQIEEIMKSAEGLVLPDFSSSIGRLRAPLDKWTPFKCVEDLAFGRMREYIESLWLREENMLGYFIAREQVLAAVESDAVERKDFWCRNTVEIAEHFQTPTNEKFKALSQKKKENREKRDQDCGELQEERNRCDEEITRLQEKRIRLDTQMEQRDIKCFQKNDKIAKQQLECLMGQALRAAGESAAETQAVVPPH